MSTYKRGWIATITDIEHEQSTSLTAGTTFRKKEEKNTSAIKKTKKNSSSLLTLQKQRSLTQNTFMTAFFPSASDWDTTNNVWATDPSEH